MSPFQFQVDYDDTIPDDREPVIKCEFCSFSTKYEKEFNIHIRTHSGSKTSTPTYQVNKSFLDELTSTIEPLQSYQNSISKKRKLSQSPKLQENKKKSPLSQKTSTGKKKGRPKGSVKKKQKKEKRVLFQCSVCESLFPNEKDVLSHAKKVHGKNAGHVSSDDEYADIQTLESDDDAVVLNNKENLIKEEILSPTKQLDFLDDWEDDEDLDDLFSPAKKPKLEIIKKKERKKSSDSKEENEYSDEKDSVSKPTCLFCHAVFFSFEAVQDHVRLNHKDRSSFKSSLKTENSKDDSKEFKEDSTGSPKRLFRCNVCGIKKVSLKFIKEHVKAHKKKRSLQCKFCGISCRNVTALKVHASKCNKAASIPKKCSQCRLKFFDNKMLKAHMKKVHKTKTPLVKLRGNKRSTSKNSPKKGSVDSSTASGKIRCEECNITFDRPSRLITHKGRHNSNTCQALGICVFCCKVFLNREQLLLHNQFTHGTPKEGKTCYKCSKVYQHQKDMKVHFMTVHFSEETENLMKQVSELKSKTDSTDKNDVYSKVFKELQDLTGEGKEGEDNESEVTFPIQYSCPACDFSFKTKREMENHIPSHNQNYCNICKSLLNKNFVVKHIENHSIESKNTKCSKCEGTFHDEVHLRFHLQQSHPEEVNFKCTMCPETFLFKSSMLEHRIDKHGPGKLNVLTCNDCDAEYTNERKYQMHVEYGHRLNLNCKFCDKSFTNVSKLSEHEKNHLKQIIFKCNICGKVLKSQKAMKTHKKNHKSCRPNIECEVCGQNFKSFYTMREHTATHSDTQEKKYFCDICGKGFYFYDSHSRHRRLHLDPLLFQCKVCRERFKTHQELVDHKETCSALTNCSECGSSFKTVEELKKHDCPCLNDIQILP